MHQYDELRYKEVILNYGSSCAMGPSASLARCRHRWCCRRYRWHCSRHSSHDIDRFSARFWWYFDQTSSVNIRSEHVFYEPLSATLDSVIVNYSMSSVQPMYTSPPLGCDAESRQHYRHASQWPDLLLRRWPFSSRTATVGLNRSPKDGIKSTDWTVSGSTSSHYDILEEGVPRSQAELARRIGRC